MKDTNNHDIDVINGDRFNGVSAKFSNIHVHPDYYAVYLLQLEPKPRSFYIGSTPDPVRRLRQHNGNLKNGGAYRTKRTGSRPWNMIINVYNFPSKVTALQFEHAFQHPYQTRHIDSSQRISKSKSSATSIHHKVANLKLLMNSPKFKSLNLKVLIFNEKIYSIWMENKSKINLIDHTFVQIVDFDKFFTHDTKTDDNQNEESLDDLLAEEITLFNIAKKKLLFNANCGCCKKMIDFIPDEVSTLVPDQPKPEVVPLVTMCNGCNETFHLDCLAYDFSSLMTSTNELNQLIPTNGECPTCFNKLTWSDLSKLSTKLRAYVLEDFFGMKIGQSQFQSQVNDSIRSQNIDSE